MMLRTSHQTLAINPNRLRPSVLCRKNLQMTKRSGGIHLLEKITHQSISISFGALASGSFAASLYCANMKGSSTNARQLDINFTSNHDTGSCCVPSTILASSPAHATAKTSVGEESIDTPMNGIKRTFLVLKRSLEIMIRLSPFLILTPTAMLVSRADFLWRGKPTSIGFGNNCSRLGEPTEKLVAEDDEGDFIFLHRFDNNDNQQFGRNCIFDCSHENWASQLTWNYALYTLQTLGPAFVKLGQWAATRRDLFPVHVCNRLSGLHDTAKTHDWKHTHNVLQEAFVERDLDLMQFTADLIDRFIPLEAVKMLSLPRAVANFSDVMKRQVDLRIEGANLHAFRRNFRCSENKSPKSIDFPEPENGWVSEKVLVEAHAGEDAVPISRYLADDSPNGLETRRKLAGPLLRAFLKMVFLDNFVHADLHPGNVLVREVTNSTNPREIHYTIIFLDAGIAMSLKDIDRKNLRDLFRAVVLNDGYTAGTLMVERARYEKCTSIPGGKHAFASEISAIVSEFHDRRKKGLTLGAVRVGALLGRVLDHCRRYGVEIDPAMSSVVRGAV
ncbi:hypothetical protein ACHAXS_004192 [Conticribra weissflogii]